MNIRRSNRLLMLVLLLSLSVPCLPAYPQDARKLAVLPMSGTGVTQEELSRFTKQFESVLAPQTHYVIITSTEAQSGLDEARFKVSDATSTSTLSEAAKILGADRVLQGSISRRGKLYTLLIRIVEASSTEVVYNRSWEHVGEFDGLLSRTNEIADDIAKEEQGISSGWKWYTIAGVAVLIGAAFYVIIKAIVNKDKTDAVDPGGGTIPPGPSNRSRFDSRWLFPALSIH
jgi:hypothetical protein